MAKKEEYTKKELRQHIYDTPDTYAGGSDLITETLPIVLEDGSISFKDIEYIPVLYNIFNEMSYRRYVLKYHIDVPDSQHQSTKILIPKSKPSSTRRLSAPIKRVKSMLPTRSYTPSK